MKRAHSKFDYGSFWLGDHEWLTLTFSLAFASTIGVVIFKQISLTRHLDPETRATKADMNELELLSSLLCELKRDSP